MSLKFLHDVDINGHITPAADNAYDIGNTSSLDFRTLYIREIDIHNQRFRLDYTGTIARLQDHSSVGDGFQFLHLGTEILRLGNGSSTTATFAGTVTTGGSLLSTTAIVDNVTAKTSSGNITFKTNAGSTIAQFYNNLSATFAGDINLGTGKSVYMSGTSGLRFLHDGTDGHFINGTGDFKISNGTSNADIVFKGNDNGSTITALTLDMSDAGAAIFNNSGLFGNSNASGYTTTINAGAVNGANHLSIQADASYLNLKAPANNITLDAGHDIILDAAGNDVLFKDAGTHIGTINMSSSNLTILSSVNDKDIIFKGKDSGSDITALTLDMSDGGWATF